MILWKRFLFSCCASFAEDLYLELADRKKGNDASSMLPMLAQEERILQKNLLSTY